jgi:hypothetical protein
VTRYNRAAQSSPSSHQHEGKYKITRKGLFSDRVNVPGQRGSQQPDFADTLMQHRPPLPMSGNVRYDLQVDGGSPEMLVVP